MKPFPISSKEFLTSCLGSPSHPKNGYIESHDTSEKGSAPKPSLPMHGTINPMPSLPSWQFHWQQHHRKYWGNRSSRFLVLFPRSILSGKLIFRRWWQRNNCPDHSFSDSHYFQTAEEAMAWLGNINAVVEKKGNGNWLEYI